MCSDWGSRKYFSFNRLSSWLALPTMCCSGTLVFTPSWETILGFTMQVASFCANPHCSWSCWSLCHQEIVFLTLPICWQVHHGGAGTTAAGLKAAVLHFYSLLALPPWGCACYLFFEVLSLKGLSSECPNDLVNCHPVVNASLSRNTYRNFNPWKWRGGCDLYTYL